jgi:hypothetical protein
MEEADVLQLTALLFHASIQVLVDGGNDLDASMVCDRYDQILQAISSLPIHTDAWNYNAKVLSPAA